LEEVLPVGKVAATKNKSIVAVGAIMFRKISLADVELGQTVFIKKSWFKTPFLFNVVKIKSHSDFACLSAHNDNLFVRLNHRKLQRAIRCMSFLSLIFEDIAESNVLNNTKLAKAVNSLVTSILSEPGIDTGLQEHLNKYPQLFKQSVRLLTLSCAFGKFLGLSKSQLQILCQSAFLADIGLLPLKSLLNAKEALTPYQRKLVEEHCELGANLVSHSDIDAAVIKNIMCHHENIDGTGYPNALMGAEVPFQARVLRIVNIYEAMTGERPYQTKKSPIQAAAELCTLARNGKIDERIVEKFCHFIKAYPINTYIVDTENAVHKIVSIPSRDEISTEHIVNNTCAQKHIFEVKQHLLTRPIHSL
jgi:HD-GYP domain-containing protein (c-di-GMP phosphodiesterase class II)